MRPELRRARRAILPANPVSPTLLFLSVCLLAVPNLARAQVIYDLVCEITQVFVDSQPSDQSDIKPGDWMILSAAAPDEGQFPTDGTPIPGGEAVFWELERQNVCTQVPPNVEGTSGAADQSRAIVENGDTDAVAWDSIGSFFTFGATEIMRCGIGLRDDDGQTLPAVNFPDPLTLEGWSNNTCFMEGNAGGQFVTVLGVGELVANRSLFENSPLIEVPYGDTDALIAAIVWANENQSDDRLTFTRIHFTGQPQDFVFETPFANSGNALPIITSSIEFQNSATFRWGVQSVLSYRFAQLADDGWLTARNPINIGGFMGQGGGGAVLLTDQSRFTANGAFSDNFTDGDGGFALVQDEARISMFNTLFSGNESEGNGGAIALVGMSEGLIADGSGGETVFQGNLSAGSGGAIFRGGSSQLVIEKVEFQANESAVSGGAISIQGDSVASAEAAEVELEVVIFVDNVSAGPGCDLHIDVSGFAGDGPDVFVNTSLFDGSCPTAALAHDDGNAVFYNNTFTDTDSGAVVVSSPGASEWYQNVLSGRFPLPRLKRDAGSTPEASCDDTGGSLVSMGYNISYDDTCNLDQATDLVNTDPLLSEPDENGVRTPLPGSPAIDHGASQVFDLFGDGFLSLPCSYRDAAGLGAPQDGDGDGGFECDSGAVEVQGDGAIEAGHSGAFFNSMRNGEGQYVEILAGGERAIIYTFSYKPDGSGAAWFIAVADVVGNSLVSDELLRPFGTSWGDGFVAEDIEFSEAGGMSMVFPGCTREDPPGNVAYSGSRDLGFEALITRAERLSDIFGCGGGEVSPGANASRSGSYFDPERNGEGLIVEWLPDGRVLVVMFTYSPEGKQMWMIGVAQADGDSVTVEALYPTGFTQWGSGFDAADVILESWGTFSLTWTDENNVTFEYAATAPAYGSATRNYQRLSTLAEAN